jgi:RNA polymerase sigma factor (sigma-70 family)
MEASELGPIARHLQAVLRQDQAALTDGQLLERFIAARDEASFEALLTRHGPMVLGVCRRLLGRGPDAEDAFQATFLVLARKAASVSPRDAVGSWLYGVARTTAIRARAEIARRCKRERQVEAMPEPEAVPEDPRDDLVPLLDEELARLPEKYRLAVILCDLEGRPRREVARQMQVPEGTLSSRLTTARRLLAGRLARRGGSLAVLLSPEAVPVSLLRCTARAALAVAAGQAGAAGLVSERVVALMEGVLKAMLLTRLKTATAVLVLVCLLGGLAAGLARSQGGEQERPQPAAERQRPDRELQQMRLEMKRLRAEVEKLKKETGAAKAAEGKQVVKVYPVAGLTSPPEPGGKEGQSLIRVISNTIEPASWATMGGPGSLEYFPAGRSLVIRQSPDVQKQVQELLQTLRKTIAEQEKAQRDSGM